MVAEDVGKGIAERELEDANLRYGVLDPAAFAQDGGPSIAERINRQAEEGANSEAPITGVSARGAQWAAGT